MEKIICSSCGAAITPNTTQPFLTCEYCDSTIANAYYVEQQAVETVKSETYEAETYTASDTAAEVEQDDSPSLAKTILTAAGAMLAGSAVRRTITPRRPNSYAARRTVEPPRPTRHAAPPRPAQPQRQPHMDHPASMNRPAGGPGSMRGPGGRGGMGPGGRGGMGGPGRGRR